MKNPPGETILVGVRIPEELHDHIKQFLHSKRYEYGRPRWSMQRVITEALEQYLPNDHELLVDCQKCGRQNFTKRGFIAHVCKGKL